MGIKYEFIQYYIGPMKYIIFCTVVAVTGEIASVYHSWLQLHDPKTKSRKEAKGEL